MDRLEFDCMFDFADTLQALLGNVDDDYHLISVYGKYDVIKPLLEDLIMSGVEIANEIELQEYAVAHYDKEFVLYLTTNGVNVEKTYDVESDIYLSGSADISFIHEDCNSKLIKYVDSKTIYEFGYDDECGCDECECTCKKDEKPATTTSSKSVYKVNGKECSKEEFDKKYEEFENKYMDNIRDMLLRYCDLMDTFNEFLKIR